MLEHAKFLTTDCELSSETCSKNVYSPWPRGVCVSHGLSIGVGCRYSFVLMETDVSICISPFIMRERILKSISESSTRVNPDCPNDPISLGMDTVELSALFLWSYVEGRSIEPTTFNLYDLLFLHALSLHVWRLCSDPSKRDFLRHLPCKSHKGDDGKL